jgi:spermidine synthase
MQVSFWKKWLSHLYPLTLEETGSELNPELSVVLDRGRLQLLSGQAIYSWDDLYHNFTRAFEQLKPENRLIEDVLLLGLGLGSVPYILEKKHRATYRYTAVEMDEVIADLASRYTLSRLRSPVEIITADAEIFVELCEDRYDLLIVDIFDENEVPPAFETPQFLEACRDLLRPGGLLLYNRLYITQSDFVRTERFMDEIFREVFPQAQHLETGGNWVLYAEMP